MRTRQSSNNGAIVGGVALVVVGLAFFLATQEVFGLNEGNIWPIFPALFGLTLIVVSFVGDPEHRPVGVFWGTLLLLLGAFFFATVLEIGVTWEDQGTVWPVYLLIVGLALLAAWSASGFRGRRELVSGSIVAALGVVLLLLTRADILYPFFDNVFGRWGWFEGWVFGEFAAAWWPMLMILGGVALLLLAFLRTGSRSRGFPVFLGSLLAMLGIFFQLTTAGVLGWDSQGRLWPVYPIAVGLAMLASYFVSDRTHPQPHE